MKSVERARSISMVLRNFSRKKRYSPNAISSRSAGQIGISFDSSRVGKREDNPIRVVSTPNKGVNWSCRSRKLLSRSYRVQLRSLEQNPGNSILTVS